MTVFTYHRPNLFSTPLASKLIGGFGALALVLSLGTPTKAETGETAANNVVFDITPGSSTDPAADSDDKARKTSLSAFYLGTTVVMVGAMSIANDRVSPNHSSRPEVDAPELETTVDPTTEPVFSVVPSIGVVPSIFQKAPPVDSSKKPFTLGLPPRPGYFSPVSPGNKPSPVDPVIPGVSPQVAAIPEPGEWATFGMLGATLLVGMVCGRRRSGCRIG